MNKALACIAVSLILSTTALQGAEHLIHPGDSPQAVLEGAAPGDRLIFLPGVHEHGVGKHRAILYVDKPVEIELKEGATLRLKAGATTLQPVGEITTDQVTVTGGCTWLSNG